MNGNNDTSESSPPPPLSIEIFTDRNLGVILSRGWSEDMLIRGRIATLTGRRFTVTVPSGQTTVKQLKHLIEDMEGIRVEDQELRRGKTVLKDDPSMNYCLVRHGSTLLLINKSEHFIVPSMSQLEEGDHMKAREMPKPTETLVIDEETDKRMNPPEDNRKQWWERSHVQSGPSLVLGSGRSSDNDHAGRTPQESESSGGGGDGCCETTRTSSSLPNTSSVTGNSDNGGGQMEYRLGGNADIETGHAHNSVEHRREVMRRAVAARFNQKL